MYSIKLLGVEVAKLTIDKSGNWFANICSPRNRLNRNRSYSIRSEETCMTSFPKQHRKASAVPSIRVNQLLVSVKSASEAALARSLGVDWIDLKNPSHGSLGAPSLEVAEAVAVALYNFPRCSVALGELHQIDLTVSTQIAKHFGVAKVGLSGMAKRSSLLAQFTELADRLQGCSLVPVLYADAGRCDAPNVSQVLDLATEVGASYLLIDTFEKDGRRLLDWLTVEAITDIIASANAGGTQVVLAGSLSEVDLPHLTPLRPAAIAVRGAVCDGPRTGEMSRRSLERWVRGFKAVQQNVT
ncbi:MAG: (5-formylfuran-3-yl)methyl phosphate synthase [Pirellulaceae bacterium]